MPAPQRKKKITAALAALAAGALPDAMRRDEQMIRQAYELLAACGDQDPAHAELEALVAACDPDAVARAGLSDARNHWRSLTVRLLHDVLDRATDVPSLVPPFLKLWRSLKGPHDHMNLTLGNAFQDRIAAQPEVLARLVDDLDAIEHCEHKPSNLDCGRGERAALLLARSRRREALAHLVDILRRNRNLRMPKGLDEAMEPWAARNVHLRDRVLMPAIRALGQQPDRLAAPSMLLAIDGRDIAWGANAWALVGAARGRPDLGAMLVECLPDRRVARELAEAMRHDHWPSTFSSHQLELADLREWLLEEERAACAALGLDPDETVVSLPWLARLARIVADSGVTEYDTLKLAAKRFASAPITPRAPARPRTTVLVRRLRAARGSRDAYFRLPLIEGLRELGAAEGFPTLVLELADDSPTRVYPAIVLDAMFRLDASRALPFAQRAVGDVRVAFHLAMTLARAPGDAVTSFLRTLASHADVRVRTTASTNLMVHRRPSPPPASPDEPGDGEPPATPLVRDEEVMRADEDERALLVQG